jgi:hypothetical protein
MERAAGGFSEQWADLNADVFSGMVTWRAEHPRAPVRRSKPSSTAASRRGGRDCSNTSPSRARRRPGGGPPGKRSAREHRTAGCAAACFRLRSGLGTMRKQSRGIYEALSAEFLGQPFPIA